MRRGIEYLKQALTRDAGYAHAHAALAECYSTLGTLFLAQPPADTRPLAAAAAQEAIRLDPGLVESHRILAVMDTRDWRWDEAEAGFRRALTLSPSDASTHAGYAVYLAARGRMAQSVTEARLSEAFDPLSLVTRTNTGWMLQLAGRHDEAIRKLQSVLDVDPGYSHARWLMGISYAELGKFDEAIDAFGTAERLTESPSTTAWRAHALARAGRAAEARELLRGLLERARDGYVPPAPMAFVYVALGEHDHAFEWLERAFDERSTVMGVIGHYRLMDPVRADPRYQDMLRRIGIEHQGSG